MEQISQKAPLYRFFHHKSERAAYILLATVDIQVADMVPIMHLGTISWIYFTKYKKQQHRLIKKVTNLFLFIHLFHFIYFAD